MSSANVFQAIQIYVKERLTFFPWFIIPVVIFYLGHGSAKFSYPLLYLLLFAVLFFRVFDDYFCFTFDRIKRKEHHHLKQSPSNLLYLVLTLGILFLTGLTLMNPQLGLVFLLFIGIHIPFYLILKKMHFIVYVSLLKYPMLFMLTFVMSGGGNPLWAILGTLFFVLREIFEENFKIRHALIETLIPIILIISKYYERFI